MSDQINLVVGEQKVITVTAKRAGAVIDLTAHEAIGVSAVKMFARTDGDMTGWNAINGDSIASYSDATNGVVTFQITTTHTVAANAGKGQYRFVTTDAAGTPEIAKSDEGLFFLEAD